jgi:YVTN family beta-propeller protein
VANLWRRAGALFVALTLLAALLAGCAGGERARPAATATPAPPILTLPSMLNGAHVFVTDLLTGDLAELGAATVHVSRSVHGLGLSHDGRWLYVSDVAGNRLVAYALKDGALGSIGAAHAVPVGGQPVHMLDTLDGRRVFVTNFAGKSVSVVDTHTWTLEKTITTPDTPHSIVLSPDGRWAYVGCYGAASIAVIDTASATLAGTIALPAGAQPYGLGLSKDGRTLYASDNFTGRLFVIDVASAPAGKVSGAVEVGLRPALIARAPDALTLYVSSGASHGVTVVSLTPDPKHPTVRASVPVSGYPHGLAVTPDGKYVVVANTTGKTLSVIETATNAVVATVPGEQNPNDALILP